jgi:hypothetical protein
MARRNQVRFGLLLFVSAFLSFAWQRARAQNDYSQLVIKFDEERKYNYEYLSSENALVINFAGTSPDELETLNHYDERLIRRVLMKDQRPQGTEVRLVLRDRNVRVLVSSFTDPFRIAIDVFNEGYRAKRDPETGLPLSEDIQAGARDQELTDAGKNVTHVEPTKGENRRDRSDSPRRLLQAPTEIFSSPTELSAAVQKIEPGIGKSWNTFPIYVYRNQTAAYEGRESPNKAVKGWSAKAMSSTEAMADYAGKLFDLGHEGRALVAYQQVLHKDPSIFEKDALHLWKFAECHLGQGNVTLAEGYYTSLSEKHPDHNLAKYAAVRKLDLAAIKALERDDYTKLSKLSDQLSQLVSRGSAELETQIAIRQSFWSAKDFYPTKNRSQLPVIDKTTAEVIKEKIPRVESQKTAFLAASLIALQLVQPSTTWDNKNAVWLAEYFDKYKGSTANEVQSGISTLAKSRLEQHFVESFKAEKYPQIVLDYNELPTPMKSIRKSTAVAWILGESLRATGNRAESVSYYETAATRDNALDRAKSLFWLAYNAGDSAEELKEKRGNQQKIAEFRAKSLQADKALEELWPKLTADDQNQFLTAYSSALETVVATDIKLHAPAKILLQRWSTTLKNNPIKMSATNGNDPTNLKGSFSPSAGTVLVLESLGKKFAELGMIKERREAIQLMRTLKPSMFAEDKEAMRVWTTQLSGLAEDYRKNNDFLQAGELYTLIGRETQADRAESLYKGGLLLFRAGKREDAIKALEEAKADANNIYYSNLATERLNQLQKN